MSFSRFSNLVVAGLIAAFIAPTLPGFSIASAQTQEIGFAEEFALSSDREKVLQKLVPGTEAHYYYHALHYLNLEQIEKAENLLKPWIKRHGNTQRARIIRNRVELMKYDSTPESTLAHIQNTLRLNLNHQRRIPRAERSSPTKLDPKLIDIERLLKNALSSHSKTSGVTDEGLEYLSNQKLSRSQLRHLLQRISYPDFPNLVDLIVRDLRERDSRGFGSLPIHKNLTIAQLKEVAKKFPAAKSNDQFVNILASKLIPSEDINWKSDPVEHRKYLDELRNYTSSLDAKFNSMKACVLYRLLELNLREQKHDKNLFMEYLQLPRNVGYVNPELVKRVRTNSHIVNLSANYQQSIRLLPVVNDQQLIEAYLQHFFVTSNSQEEFLPYIRSNFLKRQFAISKIVNGLGDTEQWASMLSPEEYKAVLNRVELDFVSTNREFYDVDQTVEIELWRKNVDKLIVKIFEINTKNYYRENATEIDTDINLDGLVPNHEETFNYSDAPALRKKTTFKFEDKLKGNGVYIVDFIGSGKSSRALIRKGRLSMLGKTTIAGQQFVVINEQGKQVKDAHLWIDGRQYDADKDGQINIPFSTAPGRTAAIITNGDFSCLQMFTHQAETYRLNAALHIDREELVRSENAKVMVRPSLTVAGIASDLRLLKNVRLTIKTTNLDGQDSTKVFEDLKVAENVESIANFIVPPRLKTVQVTLNAEVKNVSRNTTQKLVASKSYTVNQIDSSHEIQDVHLVPTSKGYLLEVLGKSGEPNKKQGVLLQLMVRGFKRPVNVDLQSNSKGQIQLGHLPNVNRLSATLTGGSKRTWQLSQNSQTYYRTMHFLTDEDIQIPVAEKIKDSNQISLWEMRGGQYVRDVSSSVSLKDSMVNVEDIPAGDYRLRLKPTNNNILLRITNGKSFDNILLGKHRHLEKRGGALLGITSVKSGPKNITVQLANQNDWTRVHVIASRYAPRFNIFDSFSSIRDIEPWHVRPAVRRSVYMAGRTIGDELQYILDRKYQTHYPGNMLTRPSLLLDPWALQDTSNQQEVLARGDVYGGVGNETENAPNREPSNKRRGNQYADFSNLDFLQDGSFIADNLEPNDKGQVIIPREMVGDWQHVRIVAVNAFSTAQRVVNLPLQKRKLKDLRLANVMDPEKHFSQTKQVEMLDAGKPFKIDDILSARFQYYDDISDVYELLNTMAPGQLNEFKFILDWPELDDAEKNDKYSKHACHELNFFLMKKDRAFFDSVVVKHLENKRDKRFMDHWLLGEDVSKFNEPWRYAKLNTFEKILLSQSMEDRWADIARNVTESYLLNPTSRKQFSMYFDASLLAGETEGGKFAEIRKGLEKADKNALPALAKAADAKKPKGVSDGPGGIGGLAEADDSFEMENAEESAIDALHIDADATRRGQYNQLAQLKAMNKLGPGQTRFRFETRTRQRPDGKFEAYTVQVPYTENTVGGGGFGGGGRGGGQAMGGALIGGGAIMDGGIVASNERFAGLQSLRESQKGFYRRLSPTREWIENNYWHIAPDQQKPGLVPANRFWRDYANHQDGEFLSPYFPEVTSSFTEMMLALAVLDLPFEAAEHKTEYADATMTMVPGSKAIAFHQQVRPAVLDRRNTTILISENFYKHSDRYRYEDGVRFDKFVSEKFVAKTLYGGQVVITNPTSTPQAIDVLIQIPQGAVVAAGSIETRTIPMDLAAFSTQTLDYLFYFPTAGDFTHFPAHVSTEDRVLAVADPIGFKVTDEPEAVDQGSWEYVSQNGTVDQVLEYLNSNNIQRVDLKQIAFRMKDKEVFKQITDVLRDRYVYDHVLWSYAVRHDELKPLQEFLSHESKIFQNCGRFFDSKLIPVDPVERAWYYHREYWPLIHARAHQVGSQRKILNPQFHRQYHVLMDVLSNRVRLSDDDNLVVSYYMLLQDRIDEAIEHFKRVNVANIDARMQYDYCSAYLDMYLEKPEDAAAKAEKWADYPVVHWQKRFQDILAQVEEIRGGETKTVDGEASGQVQTELAANSPSFDFDVESRKVSINFQNLKGVQVNYYEMDIELLFSRSPFAQDDLDGFSMIRPNVTQAIEFKGDEKAGKHELELPEALKNKNVLVEIVAGDQTKSKPYFANSLSVQMIENYGQLRVTGEENGKSIPKTYVKVYSRSFDGSVKFHKDGYTDLRGRFDYVSQSNNSIDGIEKYSILILHPEYGAIVRQVAPPKE